MKTVRLENGIAAEIIPDYALPVEKWYGPNFAAQCVEAPEDVEQGMEYDADAKTFAWPSIDLSAIKAERIAYSKIALADYLTSHPLTWTDGKQYSVTAEKQSLLTSNLSAYSIAVNLGITPDPLTWNTTGSECTEWTFKDLGTLALAIKAYVKPLVAYQQTAEVAINACTDADSVAAVPIDYESVTQDA